MKPTKETAQRIIVEILGDPKVRLTKVTRQKLIMAHAGISNAIEDATK